ncbi:MAG: hypothetical protein K2N72_09735 [Oscillospiraceae bacterium]|nr:hypothetical protein [Oscillospiraceae bacterium]
MGNAKIPVYDCILIAVFILMLSLFFTDYTIPPYLYYHDCESIAVTDYYYIEEHPGGYSHWGISIFDKQSGENYTMPVRYIDDVQRLMFGKFVLGDPEFAEEWLDLQSMPPLYLTVYNGEIVELKTTDDEMFYDLDTANWCNFYYRGGLIASELDYGLFGMILILWLFGTALIHPIDRKAALKKTFRKTSRYTPKHSSALIEY